jgi:hypothetical protein
LLANIAACIITAPVLSQTTQSTSVDGSSAGRLKVLQDPKLTPGQRTNLGLRLYRDEMVRPTPRPGPPYTDPRTHDYVMAQITRKLAAGDLALPVLRKTWETMNPGEVKDSLTILLLLRANAPERQPAEHAKGTKGSASPREPQSAWPGSIREELQEQVTAFVLERGNPLRLRELAVEALGQSAIAGGDSTVGRVLAQVIREDVQSQYKAEVDAKGKATGELVLVYPVRRAAAAAIRRMEKEGLLLESFVTAAAHRAQVETKVPKRPVRK